jgi:polyketide cyclase/dehydrase/lipid transport protein
MGRVRASIQVPALASDAEALWYDTHRWPTFIDALHHVARIEGDWPRAGARVLWDSQPGGRGRVQELVSAYAAREGQVVEVEDERLRGTQRVRFTPNERGAIVALELDYELKSSRPGKAIVDLLLVRRPQREALERTLRRFRAELAAELEASR